MKNPSRTRVSAKPASPNPAVAPPHKPRPAASGKRTKKSEVDIAIAIARELAPAAAIAVLERSPHASDEAAPALDVLVAGVADAVEDGKLRVQLMFDNGSILPVEMSKEAGKKLEAGLARQRQGKA